MKPLYSSLTGESALHEWQKKIIDQIVDLKGKRTLDIIMSGRRIGKSYMSQMWEEVNQMADKLYSEEAHAEVDGRMWYTVKCTKPVAEWIRQQPGEGTQWDNLIDNRWYIHLDMFDMHEEFYLILKLRWGE